ncbi:hypothetical protein R6Z07F_011501 [Ovis aries]
MLPARPPPSCGGREEKPRARLLAEGRRASTPGPRVPAARHEGAGETHNFPPRNDAPLLAPAGGCSRERRGGAGRRGLGGSGKPADGGPRGGGRGGGPAGDAGKPLPPVAVRQPLTSGVFLKVNNKPAAAARADRGRPSGRRGRGGGGGPPTPQRGAALEEAADPRPAPGRQGLSEPPPAAASPRRRDPAPARAEFSGDELNFPPPALPPATPGSRGARGSAGWGEDRRGGGGRGTPESPPLLPPPPGSILRRRPSSCGAAAAAFAG